MLNRLNIFIFSVAKGILTNSIYCDILFSIYHIGKLHQWSRVAYFTYTGQPRPLGLYFNYFRSMSSCRCSELCLFFKLFLFRNNINKNHSSFLHHNSWNWGRNQMKNDHSNWMYRSFGDACLTRRSRSRELAESLNTVGKLLIVTTSTRSCFLFFFK